MFEFEEEEGPLKQLVERFEAMLRSGSSVYFDLDEVEDLLEFYSIFNRDKEKAEKVLEIGELLHGKELDSDLKQTQLAITFSEYKKAFHHLSRLERSRPNDREVLYMKAQTLSELGEHEKAIEAYWKVYEMTGANNAILIEIIDEYAFLDDKATQEKLLLKGLKNDPDDTTMMTVLNLLHEDYDTRDKAVRIYEQLIENDPYNDFLWEFMADLLLGTKEYERCLWATEMALAINEENVQVMLYMASALNQLGRYEEAIDRYKEVATRSLPDQLSCFIGMGFSYERLGDLQEAFEQYENAVDLVPNICHKGWFGMASIKEKQGRYKESLAYIEKAVGIWSMHVEYLVFQADIQDHLLMFEESENTRKKVCELDPNNVEQWILLAKTIFVHRSREEGVETMLEVVKIHPDNATLHYHTAALMLASGQIVSGLQLLQNGLEIDHSLHTIVFDEFPEALNIPRVLDIVQIYGQE